MSRPGLCVAKVGGSLMQLPDLPARLRNWCSAQHETQIVLVVGGGRLVDVVREWQVVHPTDSVTAHWICVDLMEINRQLLADAMPDVPVVTWTALSELSRRAAGPCFVDVRSFLENIEPRAPGRPLEASWDVTSDSIAGRLATVLGADELVLLKSAPPPDSPPVELARLAAADYVDRFLPSLAEELPPLRLVDLAAAKWLRAETAGDA